MININTVKVLLVLFNISKLSLIDLILNKKYYLQLIK